MQVRVSASWKHVDVIIRTHIDDDDLLEGVTTNFFFFSFFFFKEDLKTVVGLLATRNHISKFHAV